MANVIIDIIEPIEHNGVLHTAGRFIITSDPEYFIKTHGQKISVRNAGTQQVQAQQGLSETKKATPKKGVEKK